MNQQALEAAAKVLHNVARLELYDSGPWEGLSDDEREKFVVDAEAALTAYAEACGERVVATNGTGEEEYVRVLMHEDETLAPGEELVVRKVGMDGK